MIENMSIVAWNFVILSWGGEKAVIDSMLFAKVILDYLGYTFGQKSGKLLSVICYFNFYKSKKLFALYVM